MAFLCRPHRLGDGPLRTPGIGTSAAHGNRVADGAERPVPRSGTGALRWRSAWDGAWHSRVDARRTTADPLSLLIRDALIELPLLAGGEQTCDMRGGTGSPSILSSSGSLWFS